jgi:hypothetical protein
MKPTQCVRLIQETQAFYKFTTNETNDSNIHDAHKNATYPEPGSIALQWGSIEVEAKQQRQKQIYMVQHIYELIIAGSTKRAATMTFTNNHHSDKCIKKPTNSWQHFNQCHTFKIFNIWETGTYRDVSYGKRHSVG